MHNTLSRVGGYTYSWSRGKWVIIAKELDCKLCFKNTQKTLRIMRGPGQEKESSQE
jgi:hypothetical protein